MAPRTAAKAKAKGTVKSKAGGRSLPRSAGSVIPSSGLTGQGKILKDGADVYDLDLNVVDPSKNMSKFYRMQVIESNDKSKYWFVQHWGRIGTAGQTQVKGPSNKDKAKKLMEQKFRQKVGKAWADRGQAGPGSGDSSARSGRGNYELTARLKAAGAKFSTGKGSVAFSLMWNHDSKSKRNDLDLHVTPPSGEKVWFQHKRSRCGGQLDVDRMQDAPKPVENIVWTKKAPKGTYKVAVHNYSASGKHSMPFQVGIVLDGGDMKTIKKTMPGKDGKMMPITTVNYK
jgi:predicted DNA-binding WGR domain protein